MLQHKHQHIIINTNQSISITSLHWIGDLQPPILFWKSLFWKNNYRKLNWTVQTKVAIEVNHCTMCIIFGTLKIGQNDPEIPNLEFESHGFLQNHVYLPTEQAETNICWIIYQDASFKICLSLFGWKVNILTKMHIVHCCISTVQMQKYPYSASIPINLSHSAKICKTQVLDKFL